MPELDRYAGTVLAAYGVTLVLLGLIVAVSWWRSVWVRRRLGDVESRVRGRADG